jgi:hypothetical protein
MTINRWYEFFNIDNGEPVAYMKGEKNSLDYDKSTNREYYFEELAQTAINLEYRLTDKGTPKGYFKYKSHAEKFNQEILKGKGKISPNKK